jgi:hypothetical protein
MTTPARTDHPANPNALDDDSIPVLTERLTLPALDLDFALPTLEQVVRAEPPPAPPPPTVDELRDAVLRAVLERLPAEIEQLVREQLRAAIDAAIAHLATEANQAVRAALSEIIERAVREALSERGDTSG